MVALALTFVGGCAYHHRVGYPPSANEIAEINRAGGGQPIAVQYVDPLATCVGGACTAGGAVAAAPGGPPPEIERIVSADNHQLAVVTTTGERWTLPADGVLGMTTRGHATWQGSVVGGLLSLPLGTLFAVFFSGPGPDVNVDPPDSGGGSSTGRSIGIVLGFAAAGAIIGAIVGYHSASFDTYELGNTGRSFGPTTLSR